MRHHTVLPRQVMEHLVVRKMGAGQSFQVGELDDILTWQAGQMNLINELI